MRIVYVCREFGPVTGGGIGTYIYNVSRVMVKRGHQVWLLTDCFNNDNMHLLPKGINLIETLPTRELRQNSFISNNHEYSYRVLDTLRKLEGSVNIYVAEFAEYGSEGFASIRAKRLLGEFLNTKLIVKLHTPQSLLYHINEDKQFDEVKMCEINMEDYCVKYADIVTSPSRSLADYFKGRVAREDILLCPYPMVLPKLKESRNFGKDQIKRVRFVGSVQVRKGLDVFIEAAKIILEKDSEFNFEIYGELYNATYFGKTYIDILKRRIPEQYSEKIRFQGGVSYSEIPQLFLESCFCVFPSRWENWANVCLEAMSMGCVVIASRNGGMGEMIVHGQNGFLIDPLNPQEIADVILSYHQDYDFLKTISHGAHDRSRQICDPDRTSTRIEANYSKDFQQRNWRNPDRQEAKVSVVIPYFNQTDYLQEAIDSVKKSTYENIEIVVVNDGSTTSEAMQAFNQVEGVVKVSKSNGGLSSARNAGIAASSGQFILPLDADDKINPDYIRMAVNALVNNSELAYISCHAHNFGAFENAYIPLGYVPELMPFINTDGKCTNLFRRSVFEQCGGYDEIMTSYEDWDFLLTLYENGFAGDVLPEELFFYRRHFDSMVYMTGNRQRSELVQYMMIKHEKAWQDFAPMMAIALACLWKKEEKSNEFAHQQIANLALKPNNILDLQIVQQTRLQLYYCQNNEYWEHNSVYVEYPQSQWITLNLNIPFNLQERQLRLDPSNRSGTILIKEISLIDNNSGRRIWHATPKDNFDGCIVLGNDECFFCQDYLLIRAATDDPQLLLTKLPVTDQSVEMMITLCYENKFKVDYCTSHQRNKPLNNAVKFLRFIKEAFSNEKAGK